MQLLILSTELHWNIIFIMQHTVPSPFVHSLFIFYTLSNFRTSLHLELSLKLQNKHFVPLKFLSKTKPDPFLMYFLTLQLNGVKTFLDSERRLTHSWKFLHLKVVRNKGNINFCTLPKQQRIEKASSYKFFNISSFFEFFFSNQIQATTKVNDSTVTKLTNNLNRKQIKNERAKRNKPFDGAHKGICVVCMYPYERTWRTSPYTGSHRKHTLGMVVRVWS